MSKFRILITFILILASSISFAEFQKFDTGTEYKLAFSPKGECQENIIEEINNAKNTILVQAYSFTSAPTAKALVNAYKRGVEVKVILDKSQVAAKYSSATFLSNMKIPVWIDYKPAIAHNKIMIIDDLTDITGSFNFTKSAQERNAENVLIIKSPKLAAEYTRYWKVRQGNSLTLDDYKERLAMKYNLPGNKAS